MPIRQIRSLKDSQIYVLFLGSGQFERTKTPRGDAQGWGRGFRPLSTSKHKQTVMTSPEGFDPKGVQVLTLNALF